MNEFKGITAPLYNDLITRGHILIAGMAGSGKSTLMHGLINSVLYRGADKHLMVLIDAKQVEFGMYERTTHCIKCATEIKDIERTLDGVLDLIQRRFKEMKARGIRTWDKTIIHLFVDEMADLVLVSKKATTTLQRICQIGRAAGIQVICATQCPLAEVIPTKIKVNFQIIVGLHTATAQHSRNILEQKGCEELPLYGEALIMYPTIGVQRKKLPRIPDEWLEKIIEADLKQEVT